MNNQFYQEMLATIKADINETIHYDQLGPYWLSPFYEKETQTYSYHNNPEIFNGNAGLCLFYLSLFKLNREKNELNMARSILNRILSTAYITQPRYYSLYTGIAGIVYTCIKIYETTGENSYLEQALEITRLHKKSLISIREMDLLTGVSGILIVVTLLYHHTKAADILDMTHQLILRLIADARISAKGLKWDHHKMAFDSLTGLSHGAAGIAYALLQTGQYFGYDGLTFMAEKALEYEMQYYLPDEGNWLDLRVGARRYNLPDAHNWQLDIFFPELKRINSWAHGAGGIALVRQYAYHIAPHPAYEQQVLSSLQYCLKELTHYKADYTLCSGRIGLIPLLLRSGQGHSEIIHQLFNEANELYHQTGGFNQFIATSANDAGLFSGKAGIGYMLVHVLSNGTIDDIILPALPQSASTHAPLFTKEMVSNTIYSKYYPHTLSGIRLTKSFNNIEELESMIKPHLTDETTPTFQLEKLKTTIWQQHKGALCYHKKISHHKKTLEEILRKADTSLFDYTYDIPDHIVLTPQKQLIEISSNDIKILETGKFVMAILSALTTPRTGYELFKHMQDTFPSRLVDEDVLKQFFLLQLRALLHACFVTVEIKQGCHL